MARKLLAITDDARLRPTLSSAVGFRFVHAMVREQLGQDAADALAEPQRIETEGSRQWMTEAAPGAPATRLGELPPEAAAPARAALAALRGRVADAYARLEASPDPDNRRKAATLLHAFEVPDDERDVWVVQGRPVLVGWGHLAANARPVDAAELVVRFRGALRPPTPPRPESSAPASVGSRQLVSAPASAMQAPPPPPAVASARRSHLALGLWLLFTGLAGAVGALLLWSCSVTIPGTSIRLSFAGTCGTAALRFPTGLEAENAALLDAIRHARLEIAERPVCAPVDTIGETVRQRGGRTGRLQITLAWQTRDDLDLEVECPGGTLSRFTEGQAGPGICGDGTHDLDANRLMTNPVPNPVENVVWRSDVPAGRYRVVIKAARIESRIEIPYTLRVRFEGEDRTCRGTVFWDGETGWGEYPIAFEATHPLASCQSERFPLTKCTSDCKR